MDILKYQCVFIIWEAKLEDSEFSLVEGILLRKVNRITTLAVVKESTIMFLKTPYCCRLSSCRAEFTRRCHFNYFRIA